MVDLFVKASSVAIGWTLDRLLGDPIWLPHPVVGFGKAISFLERCFNKGKYRVVKGAVCASLLIIAVFALGTLLVYLLSPYPVWLLAVTSIVLFYCLAGKTLEKEVRKTFTACDKSLKAGRRQVARIVGRDTANLSEQEVKTAALETLAENLSDGVIAPLFWYLLLGLPGILTYKMINTLDSMIGYRSERFRLFGKVAARIDDVANYIPSRLTALLMLAVSGKLDAIRFVWKYGKRHLSPNSGYPEAALAAILDCRFGGPHDYFGQEVYKPYIGENHRPFTTEDVKEAIKVNRLCEVTMVILTFFMSL